MTTAREEAERRYFGPLGFVSADMVSEESASQREVLAFVAGVEYQAVQPVEITDEMVERAALAGLNSERRRHGLDERTTLDDFDNQTAREWRADARAQLEAVLGGEA